MVGFSSIGSVELDGFERFVVTVVSSVNTICSDSVNGMVLVVSITLERVVAGNI